MLDEFAANSYYIKKILADLHAYLYGNPTHLLPIESLSNKTLLSSILELICVANLEMEEFKIAIM